MSIRTEVTGQAPIGCTFLGLFLWPQGRDFPCGGRVEHQDDQTAKEHYSHVVVYLCPVVAFLFESSDDVTDVHD